MRLLTVLCFCLFATTFLSAQNEGAVETAVLAHQAEETTYDADLGLHRGRERTLLGDLDLSGAWGGPTYNYSMTGDDWALVRGGFGGLEFGEEFFLGYGGWKGREAFTVDEPTDASPNFQFQHSGFILAYTPLSDKVIHPRITTIIGPGKIDLDPQFVAAGEDSRDRMLIGQAMVGFELNLFQWFRLGVDGGYRFASGVDTPTLTSQDISGTVLQIEARFGFSW